MSPPWTRFYEEGVPATISYPRWTLPDLLDDAASRYASLPALTFFVDAKLPPSRMTYAELRDATLRFATALHHLGVRKGDRVAIMLPNCPQFAIAFFGLLRLGAIAVNTNPLYVAREMKEQFSDSGAKAVILLDAFVPRLEEIRAQTAIEQVIVVDVAETLGFPWRSIVHLVQKKHGERVAVAPKPSYFFFKEISKKEGSVPSTSVGPGDVALFQYTGGTTGTPKAAMLTHANLVANTLQLSAW